MIGTAIAVIVTYYICRLMALIAIGIAIDDWRVTVPSAKTFIFEPFNFRKYIFFETRAEYESYAEKKNRKGKREWWR